LKQSYQDTISTEFPTNWIADTPTPPPQPERVLDKRSSDPRSILIKWSNQDLAEATWEDPQEIKLRFPDFLTGLEDESNLMGEGIDMTHYPDTGPLAITKPKRSIRKLIRFQN
nr:hypothetical protein [Tanacetum cinerariifolium]